MNPVSFPHRVPGGLRLSGLATGGLGLVVALAAGAAPSPPRGPITNRFPLRCLGRWTYQSPCRPGTALERDPLDAGDRRGSRH